VDIRAIRYFLAAAETENLSRASERLNIVQSALSHQIRGLEDELGVELFVRHGRRIRLSQVGQVFLQDARKLMADLELAKQRVARAARGAMGELRVGFETISSRNRLVSRALLGFRETYPDVSLQLSAFMGGPLREAIRAGEVDAGFVPMLGASPDLQMISFGSTDWVLALPRDHPLAAKPRLLLSDLEGQPFIWRPRDVSPIVYDHLLGACRERGFTPHIVQEAHNEMMLSLVSVGLGVGLLVENIAEQHASDEMVAFRKVEDFSMPLDLCLVWRRDNPSRTLPNLAAIVRGLAQETQTAGASPLPRRAGVV
jgi:DNA-binding transcriptional LysR family regulator